MMGVLLFKAFDLGANLYLHFSGATNGSLPSPDIEAKNPVGPL